MDYSESDNKDNKKVRGKYLADTTVIVEMLRGNERAHEFLKDLPEISQVTVAELIQGCQDKKDLSVIETVTNALPQVKIDKLISDKAIELLKKYYLSDGLIYLDALIAAHAIVRKKVLVTSNLRDYNFIEGLAAISHKEAFGEVGF